MNYFEQNQADQSHARRIHQVKWLHCSRRVLQSVPSAAAVWMAFESARKYSSISHDGAKKKQKNIKKCAMRSHCCRAFWTHRKCCKKFSNDSYLQLRARPRLKTESPKWNNYCIIIKGKHLKHDFFKLLITLRIFYKSLTTFSTRFGAVLLWLHNTDSFN